MEKKITYEDTFNKLEEVLRKLENDSPSLDQSLDLYEQGISLYRQCNNLLDQAQLKITRLNRQGEEEEFDLGDDNYEF